MKALDYFVRLLTVATFIALIFAPARWGFTLGLFSLVVVGTWALLFPEGILGWAKTAHPQLDVRDPSIWWVPRLIGAGFLIMVLLIAVGIRWH